MNTIICKSCDGEGRIKETEYRDWKYVQCSRCKGTGRLLSRTYTIEVPFTLEPKELSVLYKIDSKIIEIIRNLKK